MNNQNTAPGGKNTIVFFSKKRNGNLTARENIAPLYLKISDVTSEGHGPMTFLTKI